MKLHLLLTPLLLAGMMQRPVAARIEGIVVDGDTGQSLEGVEVVAGSDASGVFLRARTDGKGNFSIDNVLPGTVVLSTNRAGYLGVRTKNRKYGLPSPSSFTDPYLNYLNANVARATPPASGILLAVSSGANLQLRLSVFPAPIVSGRVYNDRGEPVQDMGVVAFRYGYDNSGIRTPLQDTRRVTTNDLGEYRFNFLEPGLYGFRFVPPTLRLSEVRAVYFSAAYYPGTPDLSRASLVELRGGEETILSNVILPGTRGTRLSLRLPDAVAAMNRTVMIIVRQKSDTTVVRSGPLLPGASSIGELPAGSYEVQAEIVGLAEPIRVVQTVDLVNTEKELQLEFSAPGMLTGQVHMESSETGVTGSFSSIQLHFLPVETSAARITFRVGPDGRIPSPTPAVAPGVYRVSVGGIPEGAYLSALRIGDRDLTKGEIQVRSDEIVEVAIILGAPSGIVKGTVADDRGQRIPGAFVALLPDDRTQSHKIIARLTDADGHFQMPSAPGAYHLYAWSELEGAAFRNSDFMRDYDAKGIPVNLERGETISIGLRILDQ